MDDTERMVRDYKRVVGKIQDAISQEKVDDIVPALSSVLAEVGAFSEIEKKQLVYFVVGAIDRIYRNHEGGSCEHQGKPN